MGEGAHAEHGEMVDDLGETKVGDLCGVLVGGEKDVFGLEVAVGDALRVDVLLGLEKKEEQ